MKRVSDSLMFKHRGWLGIAFLVPVSIAAIFTLPIIKEDSFLDLLANLLGWICFVLYVTFRIWATLYVGGRKDRELQTEGPYSMTRNPLYFGSFCLALSVTLFLKSFSLLIAALIASFFYASHVIAAEEKVLEGIFGEQYSEYARKTPRLFPNLSLYRGLDSISVNLREVRREAARLWLGALIPLLAELVMHLRVSAWWPHWFSLP